MSEEKRTGRRVFAGLQRAAPLANGLLLLIFVIWVLCFDRSRTELLDPDLLRASNQPEAADSGGPRSSTILVGGLVAVSFLVMLLGLWWGRPKSRSISAWFVFSFLICGWLAVWVGRNDLYWFGHAWRVSGEVSAATALADGLTANWPSVDGDHPELGFVLGYPKQAPVTLMLAGEPVAVGRLRIVAVDQSKDGRTLRFQLANPNHDTWLVRSSARDELAEFVNGFDSRFRALRIRPLSGEWYLVRYAASFP